MLKRTWTFLNEFLRINAIRRMFAMVEVKRTEVGGLVGFAVLFALFEGIGLALLLPILQYADGGQTAILDSSGFVWQAIREFMDFFNLPVTLPVLLLLAFIPILLRQVVFYFNAWYSAVVSTRIGMRLRMQTLDTIFDADPEFFSRHAVGTLVGIVIAQTGVGGTRSSPSSSSSRSPCSCSSMSRYCSRSRAAHAQHPVFRGRGVARGARQHQTHP